MIIEIEGIDGVGKTTVAKLLAEKIGATYLKFPDRTTPTGEVIDQMLRDKCTHDPVTFQALQVVNRLEKLSRAGLSRYVVCDRYKQSAYVYGEQDGLDPQWLRTIMLAVPEAHLHVLLHMDVDRLDAERLAGRDREVYEVRGVDGLRDQQQRFFNLWQANKDEAWWCQFDTGAATADRIVDALVAIVKVAVL